MDKKKVLLVHNYYQIGGGEHIVFENEKNMLLKNGHAVCTYTRSNDELKTSKWKLLLLPLTTIWSFKTYTEVRRLIRGQGIDVVHCHNTFPLISPSVYYAARSLKIPVVQTVHNFRFLCPNGLFFCNGAVCERCREQNSFAPALKNGCYRNSRLQTAVVAAMLKIHRWLGTYRKINYIFLTEFNKEKFRDLIDIQGSNVFVKPNFVNEPEIRTQRQGEKPVFVFAGRLDKNKGIDFLLDVWLDLPEEYELHIYGDGPYREACEAASEGYGNIRFFGFRPQGEVMSDLANAAALLFTSTGYETFGMAWAESFSIGRPVVAANIGNQAELIGESRGGALYEAGDQASFAAALEDVLAHNRQYSEHAQQYYHSRLNREHNYEKLSEIYDKAQHIR